MDDKPHCWKFHAHTADAKFEAYGKTLEELFTNAALACFEIITDTTVVKTNKQFSLAITAKQYESLLFDFLDELLFLLDTEGFLLHEIQDVNIVFENNTYSLTATVYGDYHKGYDVSCNVKAVTYNDMYIKTPKETNIKEGENNAWQCQVVVDL